MSARTPPFWAAFVFVVVLAGCATSIDPFEVNRRQAEKDSQTPEGRAYEREFYPAIGPDLTQLLKKCTTEFPTAIDASFELVFRVDHWGEPLAVLVNPATDVSTCVAAGFWYFTFPHPDQKFERTGLALLLPISIR